MGYSLHEFVACFDTAEVDDYQIVREWALSDTDGNIKTGSGIESFFDVIKSLGYKSPIIYFHDLRFSADFIISYLFKNGYAWKSKNYLKLQAGEFSTNIAIGGEAYGVNVCTECQRIRFKASNKLFNASEDKLAAGYGKTSYEDSCGMSLTQWKASVVAYVLGEFRKAGYRKYTAASSALYEFVTTAFPRKDGIVKYQTSLNMFKERHQITEEEDQKIRQSYYGGLCYLNPKFAGKTIQNGIVLDANSMFPSVMYMEKMPYGKPYYSKGKPHLTDLYDLYVSKVRVDLSVKERGIPFLTNRKLISDELSYKDNITDTHGESIELWLTSVDIENLFNNYDVYNIDYIESYSFKSKKGGYFKEYIEKFYAQKQRHRQEGNEVLASFDKIFLNGLYGKFGTNCTVFTVSPQENDDQTVKYKFAEYSKASILYVPLSAFITAYARRKLLNAIADNYDRFIYCDTDSIHLIGTDAPVGIEVNSGKLGAWKVEAEFTRARYLKPKQYIEESVSGELIIRAAGLHSSAMRFITFDNFVTGNEFPVECVIPAKGGKKIIQSYYTL